MWLTGLKAPTICMTDTCSTMLYCPPNPQRKNKELQFPSDAFKAHSLLLGWNQGYKFWLKSGKRHRCEPSPSMQITVSQMWPPVYAKHNRCHRCELPSMWITVGVTDVTSCLCKSQWVFPDKLSFLTNYVKNDENSPLTAVFWNKIFLCPCRWSVLMSTVTCAVITCSNGEKSLFPLPTHSHQWVLQLQSCSVIWWADSHIYTVILVRWLYHYP